MLHFEDVVNLGRAIRFDDLQQLLTKSEIIGNMPADGTKTKQQNHEIVKSLFITVCLSQQSSYL